MRNIEDIQEDIRTLQRIPIEDMGGKLEELSEEVKDVFYETLREYHKAIEENLLVNTVDIQINDGIYRMLRERHENDKKSR